MLCVVRGLCDELITRPEESYRLWCVFMCDHVNEEALAHWGLLQQKTNINFYRLGFVVIFKI